METRIGTELSISERDERWRRGLGRNCLSLRETRDGDEGWDGAVCLRETRDGDEGWDGAVYL